MAAPRYIFQVVRLPMTLFGVGAGAAGYANYKLNGESLVLLNVDILIFARTIG
jgi:hypothetical protein